MALAVAGGLVLVVAVALYAFGRTHTPSYAMGLFGHPEVEPEPDWWDRDAVPPPPLLL